MCGAALYCSCPCCCFCYCSGSKAHAAYKQNDNSYSQDHLLDHTIQTFIRENALHPQEKDFYNRKIEEFDEQRSSLEEKIQKLESKKENAFTRREFLNTLIRELEQRNGPLTEFDDKLCRLMVENITVSHDGLVVFTFWNGEKYETEI